MKEPTEKLADAIKLISEAARLHILLNAHASEPAVSKALIWRYEVSEWEAQETYNAALKMLDLLPKKR